MKKILSIIFVAVMSSVILGGCSKDDDDITGSMKLTNLSGIDWYDGEVWYSDVPNGDLNGDVDFGTLKVGETTTVKTKRDILLCVYQKFSRQDAVKQAKACEQFCICVCKRYVLTDKSISHEENIPNLNSCIVGYFHCLWWRVKKQ